MKTNQLCSILDGPRWAGLVDRAGPHGLCRATLHPVLVSSDWCIDTVYGFFSVDSLIIFWVEVFLSLGPWTLFLWPKGYFFIFWPLRFFVLPVGLFFVFCSRMLFYIFLAGLFFSSFLGYALCEENKQSIQLYKQSEGNFTTDSAHALWLQVFMHLQSRSSHHSP